MFVMYKWSLLIHYNKINSNDKKNVQMKSKILFRQHCESNTIFSNISVPETGLVSPKLIYYYFVSKILRIVETNKFGKANKIIHLIKHEITRVLKKGDFIEFK